MSLSENERQEALHLIETANRRMAGKARAPEWYHWALGVMVGGLCAVQALPMPWPIAYELGFVGGLWWLMRAYRRHTGMWIPGYRAGRTRWVAFSSAAAAALIFLGAIWIARKTGQPAAYLAGGAVLAIVTTLRGYAWEMAYRRDLGVD